MDAGPTQRLTEMSTWGLPSDKGRPAREADLTAQNYWVFGLCPSSGILEARKHNVSETGSVFVLR
jgi:hypothetical protein